MFQHELDHLNGFNILHKEVSEGEIEFLDKDSDDSLEYEKVETSSKRIFVT